MQVIIDSKDIAPLAEAGARRARTEAFWAGTANRPCPRCLSLKTGTCGNDPEIDDRRIGRCGDCGQLWCLACGHAFAAEEALVCRCFGICRHCPHGDGHECGALPSSCDAVRERLAEAHVRRAKRDT